VPFPPPGRRSVLVGFGCPARKCFLLCSCFSVPSATRTDVRFATDSAKFRLFVLLRPPWPANLPPRSACLPFTFALSRRFFFLLTERFRFARRPAGASCLTTPIFRRSAWAGDASAISVSSARYRLSAFCSSLSSSNQLFAFDLSQLPAAVHGPRVRSSRFRPVRPRGCGLCRMALSIFPGRLFSTRSLLNAVVRSQLHGSPSARVTLQELFAPPRRWQAGLAALLAFARPTPLYVTGRIWFFGLLRARPGRRSSQFGFRRSGFHVVFGVSSPTSGASTLASVFVGWFPYGCF